MNWKYLALLALAATGCTDTKDDDDDDTAAFGGGDYSEPSACTTTLDIYEAYAFAPSVVRLAFRLFCGDENIAGKTADDFTILEDDAAVSAYESDLSMVPITASFQLSTALVFRPLSLSSLRVRQFSSLRVCDASVFTTTISSPPALTCAAMGHLLGSMLVEENKENYVG